MSYVGLKNALLYSGFGWAVIPIPHGQKAARVHWKRFQQDRPTEQQLRKWFNGKPVNLAVILGPVSGNLCCRDFDDMAAYEAWAATHPDLARTLPTVETARGRHVYFRGELDGVKELAGGELRGARSYCVLPPSLHPSGATYRWVTSPTADNLTIVPLAEFGAGLTQGTQGTHTQGTQGTHVTQAIRMPRPEGRGACGSVLEIHALDSATRRAIEKAIVKTLPFKQGQRNLRMIRLAVELKGIAALADCSAGQLKSVLREWHTRALAVIRTKAFDLTWAEFVRAWDDAKHPRGSWFRRMIERAKNADYELDIEAQYESAEFRLLLRVCHVLMAEDGGDTFFIGCRKAGEVIGQSHESGNDALHLFVHDDVIEVVKKGISPNATVYRFCKPPKKRQKRRLVSTPPAHVDDREAAK
jgi:hypothetical protein